MLPAFSTQLVQQHERQPHTKQECLAKSKWQAAQYYELDIWFPPRSAGAMRSAASSNLFLLSYTLALTLLAPAICSAVSVP
mmetsp:Transcript_5749/g.10534  ORF Transcript_5749/g.10534 Transcript_5749/m.10534 type:complete len:81 (-) Transcript_5749:1248-1490(-)